MIRLTQTLHRLRISHKLFVSALTFALPIAVLLFFYIADINYNIRFARLEIMGNEHQRVLEKLLDLAPQYLAANLDKRGDASLSLAAKIDDALRELTEVNQRLGADLQFTPEGLSKRNRERLTPTGIKGRWSQFKVSPTLDPYSMLMADLREMIVHCGDASNLILDPDLDSYYLMDATLIALPQTQDRLAAILFLGRDILSRGALSAEDRVNCLVQASLLQESDMDRVDASVKNSLAEDAAFHGSSPSLQKNLPTALQDYLAANRVLVEMLRRMGGPKQAGAEAQPVTLAVFTAAAVKARSESFKLWNLAALELDILLGRRIQDFTATKITALLSTTAAILTAAILAFAIGLGIVRPVRRIQGYTRRIAEGDLEASLNDAFGGELAELSEDVKAMVIGLKAKIHAETKREELESETQKALAAMAEAKQARDLAKRVEAFQKKEIRALALTFKALAQGDLTTRYAVGEAEQDIIEAQNGFHDLELAVNGAVSTLQGLVNKLKGSSDSLINSAESFLILSGAMLRGSREMSRQTLNAASASEQISAGANSMASAAEEMSVSVNTISSTAEEMSTTLADVAETIETMSRSIEDIARNAKAGSRVADQAMGLAGDATDTMKTLGVAAKDIGKVTDVIKRIAEQTNLLALNATIEAASAGEAGRGFAVVAHEIKELANQSAKAAEDIADKIQGVQGSAEDAVKVIAEVSGIIEAINASVGAITQAVDKQHHSAGQIEANVAEVNKGAGGMALSIAELSNGADDMSRNTGEVAKNVTHVAHHIVDVSRLAGASQTDAESVHKAAKQLALTASDMADAMDAFKVGDEE